MIAFTCSHCDKKFSVKPEFAGRTTRCSNCKQSMVIPSLDATIASGAALPTDAKPAPDQTMAYEPPAAPVPPPASPRPAPDPTMAYDASGQATCAPTNAEGAKFANDATLAAGGASLAARLRLAGGVTLAASGDTAPGQESIDGLLGKQAPTGERYILDREIARGGMGAVLRAIDCDIRREVAVKYLLNQRDQHHAIRFVEEAQITGQLEHPNIVPIHELGIDALQRVFFSMKMVKGRSLAQVLDALDADPKKAEKEFSLGRLMNIFVSICNALAYAHSRGVVHRDLKPANVMVGDFGEVYVMDWGLAKVLKENDGFANFAAPPVASLAPAGQAASGPLAVPVTAVFASDGPSKVVTNRNAHPDLTQEGSVLGTPVYMSPEQAIGQIQAIDERSDIYSLGAILYEILTLRPPVAKEGGLQAIIKRVIEGEITPPERRDPERARAGRIPPELAAIAMKALALHPERRYQSVEFLRRDVELFLEGRSVSAKTDTTTELVVKFVKRNRALSGVSLAAAVLMTLVVGWTLLVSLRAARDVEKAYKAYEAEQVEKEERTRRAVPALVKVARMETEQRQFDRAIPHVALALEYDPGSPEARLLKAQLALVRQDFKGAAAEYDKYLAKRPNDRAARDIKKLCASARADDKDKSAILEIASILSNQDHGALAEGVLQKHGASGDDIRRELLALYRARVEKVWKGRGAAVMLANDGFDLHLNGEDIKDLSAVQGMMLRSVHLECRGLRDLSALQGMPLEGLTLRGCNALTNVDSLKGLALKTARFQNCDALTDLSGLKEMPLGEFELQRCPGIRDLRPLQGMPLANVRIEACPAVVDLAGLRGLPLKTLTILDSGGINDLTPLKGMALKDLTLLNCPNIRELAPLAEMPLTTLNLAGCGIVQDLAPLQGMPLVNLDLTGCIEVRNLKPLQGLPLKSLNLANCGLLADLSGLKGLKLTNLSLAGCGRVSDLSVLQGMPLTQLRLEGTAIKDTNALKGMTLTSFPAGGCASLTDLSGLRGMPLTHVDLRGCVLLTDLSPLQGMSINTLMLDGCSEIADLTPLRGLPLQDLRLEGCAKITSLAPLKEAILNNLILNRCSGLKDLTGLEGMRFNRLELHGCTNLTGLDGLKGVPISQLTLSQCTKLESLAGLKGRPLQHLQISQCDKLTNLEGLEGMPLTNLHIDHCVNLADWSGLKKLPLTSLSIANCPTRVDLTPMQGSKISQISLSQCTQVTDLAPLQGLPLTHLTISGCPVKDLSPLRGMPLTSLQMEKCLEIQDLTPLADLKLQEFRWSPQALRGVDSLRAIKSLLVVNNQPAMQFWSGYDAEFGKKKN